MYVLEVWTKLYFRGFESEHNLLIGLQHIQMTYRFHPTAFNFPGELIWVLLVIKLSSRCFNIAMIKEIGIK